jgi:hypothetical protein
MIKLLLFLSMIFMSNLASAEIYKCTVAGHATYGDSACASGTGGVANIFYDRPTPDQIEEYRDILRRQNDYVDTRISQRAFESYLYQRSSYRHNRRNFGQSQMLEVQPRRYEHQQPNYRGYGGHRNQHDHRR